MVALENVNFTYPEGAQALRDLSVHVGRGQVLGLCGPMASGKSTLLRLVKHLIAPAGTRTGGIRLDGREVRDIPAGELAARVGFLYQQPYEQLCCETVFEELCFGLQNIRLSRDQIFTRVAEVSAAFSLEGILHARVAELSGGQVQLINLAAVMAMRPSVLLLDEPTASLDPVGAAEFFGHLRTLRERLELTVILCEHQLGPVLDICDRVIWLDGGRKVFDGTRTEGLAFLAAHHAGVLPVSARVAGLIAPGGEIGRMDVSVPAVRAALRAAGERVRVTPRVPASAGERLLEARGVYLRYAGQNEDVLRELSLELFSGQVFCLLGANGVGKTTLLSALTGIVPVYRGKIRTRERCAYLPQQAELVFACESLGRELELLGKNAAARAVELTGKYEFFSDIPALYDCNVLDLSGGQLQKAALFRVLLSGARVVLLDEPTRGLDAPSRRALNRMLRALAGDGAAVMLATHDLEFAAGTADRVAVLFDGTIAADGTPYAVMHENLYYTSQTAALTAGLPRQALTVEELCYEK